MIQIQGTRMGRFIITGFRVPGEMPVVGGGMGTWSGKVEVIKISLFQQHKRTHSENFIADAQVIPW